MLQPANVAIPATAGFGLVVQPKVSAPGVVMAMVERKSVAKGKWPEAGCTFTTGWTPNARLPGAQVGEVVKASGAAVHALLARLVLVAGVNPPSVAVRV